MRHAPAKRLLPWLGVAAGLLLALPGAVAARADHPTGVAASVPPAERALPATIAARPVVVPDAAGNLECPVFDVAGDLLFSDVQNGRVRRLGRDGRFATVATLPGLMPGGMALDGSGRLLVAAGNGKGGGAVVAVPPGGGGAQAIVPESAGFFPNDLVLDAAGGFYFTDCRGGPGDPAGGVFYVPPGGGTPVPVVRNLAVANGIALSPDGKRLWLGEFALGRLYRLDLSDATTVTPFGAGVAYHFTGLAPDSMRVDADGHVYVALYGQGRILVFSHDGLPVGQILLPGRDAGRNLNLTSMAIRPGSRDMVIVTSDGRPGGKATIFRARAWGNGLPARSSRQQP